MARVAAKRPAASVGGLGDHGRELPDRPPEHPVGPRVAERLAAGRALRERAPRSSHGAWRPAADRPDPVDLLERQAAGRLPNLTPVRYGRMLTSPFAFLRGSAAVMADDLATTPTSGITVQACGDAHLSNFGVYATPERNIIFDLNDFDETLTAPWEWDLKRLAMSLVVAGRNNGFTAAQCRDAALAAARAYQERMGQFALMGRLDVWYWRIDADQTLDLLRGQERKLVEKGLAKARLRDNVEAQAKLTEVVDGRRRIKSAPPLIVPIGSDDLRQLVRELVRAARRSLQPDRLHLLSGYQPVDAALKVVGVGSVGTRCYIALLEGIDDTDPLMLQVKEASASVLEPYAGRSRYRNHGQRVVQGQRLMQTASDTFLSWIRGPDGRDYYCRQLRDVKGSIETDTVQPGELAQYGQVCAAALARAHARSGDPAMIAGYLGSGDVLPKAVAGFADAYADQTERDYQAMAEAVKRGRIQAEPDV